LSCAMELDYCKIGLRYSSICQGTSARMQQRDLFDGGMKLSLVTTSLSTQIKVEAIPLSACPRTQQTNLPAYLHTIQGKTQAAKMCFCSVNSSFFFILTLKRCNNISQSKLELNSKKSSSSDAKNVGRCLYLSFLHLKPV